MKHIDDEGYVYVPEYNTCDMRSESEKTRELATRFMFILFILLGCWIGGAILLLMIPKSIPLLYWPFAAAHFVGKWSTIIGWPIWLIIEIVGIVLRGREKREEKEDYGDYIRKLRDAGEQ